MWQFNIYNFQKCITGNYVILAMIKSVLIVRVLRYYLKIQLNVNNRGETKQVILLSLTLIWEIVPSELSIFMVQITKKTGSDISNHCIKL